MPPPRSSRREFLRGRAAADAVAAWADGVGVEARLADPAPGGYLMTFSRPAMATTFQVILNARQYPQGPEAAVAALDLIEQLEEQLTVYRDSSEVMRINRLAHAMPVAVEPRLSELLRHARQLHIDTGGAFDITAGPLSKVWGFYRRQGEIPTETALSEALAAVGMRHVTLGEDAPTVEFAREGVEVNLGAIGKGYALDRAAELLVERGVGDFVLHGGASSVLARGSRQDAKEDDCGWLIGVGDPQRPGERLALLTLRDEALGTSGAAFQFFRHQGRRLGHILDPRTGRPAEGMLSATVIAPTAAEADALSTAFYVMGVDEAERYCASHPRTRAIVVTPADKAGEARVAMLGEEVGKMQNEE